MGLALPQVIQVGPARDIVGGPLVVAIQGGDVKAALEQADKEFNAFLLNDK